MIRAGELNQRVAIQRWSPVNDALWGKAGTGGGWNNIASGVWAKIEPISATERSQDQGVQSAITHRITMRYTPDITSKDRLATKDGRVLNIVGIIDIESRREELQIEAREFPQEAANGN